MSRIFLAVLQHRTQLIDPSGEVTQYTFDALKSDKDKKPTKLRKLIISVPTRQDVPEGDRLWSVVFAAEKLEVRVPDSTGLFELERVFVSVFWAVSGGGLSAVFGRRNRIPVMVYHPRTVLPLRWELNLSLLVPGFRSAA